MGARVAIAFVLLVGMARGQELLHHLDGVSAKSLFGHAVDGAGDVDHDGHVDLIVGAPDESSSISKGGCARVFSGFDGRTILNFYCKDYAASFGSSVAGGADVNNDGWPDLCVGSRASASGSGFARVFSGRDSSQLYTFQASAAWDNFGRSVDIAGDVNGDGFADVMVGGDGFPYHGGPGAGVMWVYSGQNGATLHHYVGDSATDGLGFAVSFAGDVDGDGFDDMMAGAFGDDPFGLSSGSAYVWSGQSGLLLHTFHGDSVADYLGWSVSAAGDVNGDGFDDVIVGAFLDDQPGTQDSGAARVFSGKDGSLLYLFWGDASGDIAGYSVGGAADADGDGFDDLVVGMPEALNYSGRVRLYSGKDGTELYTVVGGSAGDELGCAVAFAGDVDQDGSPDVIAGGEKASYAGTKAGCARVYSGHNLMQSYGAGCIGSGGFVPELSLSGWPVSGGQVSLTVSGGLGGAPCLFFFGLTQASIPMGFGCQLLVSPPLPLIIAVPLGGLGPGAGSVTLSGLIPVGVSGVVFTTQAFIDDPGVSALFANTNGLEVTVP